MIPDYRDEILLRLKTVRGHLDGVTNMVERERYCPDVMKQVAALQASLEKVNRILLRNHLETCVSEAILNGGGKEKIDELLESLRFNSALTDLRHNGLEYSHEQSESSCESCESPIPTDETAEVS
jgi:DNA-binding FrmR family transcriptional regulator